MKNEKRNINLSLNERELDLIYRAVDMAIIEDAHVKEFESEYKEGIELKKRLQELLGFNY